MYILKNALKSITRTKWRNILIGVIIVVIAISSCVALSIRNSATKLIESYENSSEVIANISLDRGSMQKDLKEMKESEEFSTPQDFMNSMGTLDLDTQILYADSEYVTSYYYTNEISLNGNDDLTKVSMDMEFKKPSSDNDNVSSDNGGKSNMDIPSNQMMGGKSFGSLADFTVIGYSSLDAMSEFITGTYKITEGEMFDINAENVCVISNELAEENEIVIGDKITLVNPDNEEEIYTLTVTGIYIDNTEGENTMSLFSNAANQILTNVVTIDNITTISQANEETQLDPSNKFSYILSSKDSIEKFETELKEKGLSDYYTVSTNLSTLEEELEPIQNLSNFATTLLIIVLCVGGIILVVINMINIRERKYEIGVLRSIGMKKGNVLLQFVIELFLVTFVAIVIGTIIGSLITVPVSNKLLENEIESTQTESGDIANNFGMQGGKGQIGMRQGGKGDIRETFAGTDYVDKLNAVVDVKTICELVLIGIVLTICSSAISMAFISRYSPLKILSSRS